MEVRIRHRDYGQRMPGAPSRYPNCVDLLGVYYTRTGRLHTGLIPEDEKRLGEMLGLDLRPFSEFWHTFRIPIKNETIVLRPDEDPMDELKYLFLKNHKHVASSITDMTKPHARYYISIAEQEAEVSNTYNRIKRKAYKEFDKMSPEDIKKALRVLGFKADNVSDAVAEDRLTALIESNPQRFFDKWVNNETKHVEYLLKEAVAKSVVKKTKNIHSYGSVTLGNTMEDAIVYLNNPENTDIKTAIINEINGK